MKKKVKFLDAMAGLADPKPKAALDAKYAQIREKMETPPEGSDKGASKHTIDAAITEAKKRDRYGDPAWGFARDFSFKVGDEAVIDAKLAEHWEAAGYCTVIEDATKKAA